jgi:hypothetical protein
MFPQVEKDARSDIHSKDNRWSIVEDWSFKVPSDESSFMTPIGSSGKVERRWVNLRNILVITLWKVIFCIVLARIACAIFKSPSLRSELLEHNEFTVLQY